MAQHFYENSTFARRVTSAAQHGALSHAVILSGSGDRLAAGRYLAAAYLCQAEQVPCLQCNVCRKVMEGIHPDVITVQDSERKELTVDTVRALKQDVYIRPNEGARKVYLFADSSQLNERDQNVLLKIVEEGPSYAAFIFCTESSHALLPTVRSRCVEFPLQEDETASDNEEATALCRVIGSGNPLKIAESIAALENRRGKREQLQSLLQDIWRIAAEALLVRCGKTEQEFPDGIAALQSLSVHQLQQLISLSAYYREECQYNIGPAHVLGALLADLTDLWR